jgi:hypothetical protein
VFDEMPQLERIKIHAKRGVLGILAWEHYKDTLKNLEEEL